MRTLVTYLPALVCGAMVLLMCVPMLLRRQRHQSNDQNVSPKEIAELREEIRHLKAERALEDKSEMVDG